MVHSYGSRRTPVLWLCGPPGVGKSTVGWQIYRRLNANSRGCAYVDIDQLGMCYPESGHDPGRHGLKERNLGAVVANFVDAGARGVVVSGVVGPTPGTGTTGLADLEVALCRLRTGPDQLRQRLESRRGSFAGVEDALAEAVRLDSSGLPGTLVDTTGLTVEQTAEAVLQASEWAPADGHPEPAADRDDRPPSPAGGQVIWLCGPTGVGKSTIGFALYLRLMRAGLTAGYIDADQVGFCAAAPRHHQLKASNVAAVWENYRSASAAILVAVGPVGDGEEARLYEAVLPRASFKWFRLHSGPRELARRIQARQSGGSWPQPGDPLRGASPGRIQQASTDAAAQAAELDHVGFGIRVDSEKLTVEESASAVLSQVGLGGGT